ncbi:MAG: sulfur-oxidizing protein SoxX [Oceanicoccus sp.]
MIRFTFLTIMFITCIDTASADDRDAPLTTTPGRHIEGEKAFNNRDKGHCLLCHQLSRSDELFQGTIGPSLDDITARLDPHQIRYRIVDNSRLNHETLMPAYFQTEGLVQVAQEFRGKTILSAQEIEDIIAYLIFDREGQ